MLSEMSMHGKLCEGKTYADQKMETRTVEFFFRERQVDYVMYNSPRLGRRKVQKRVLEKWAEFVVVGEEHGELWLGELDEPVCPHCFQSLHVHTDESMNVCDSCKGMFVHTHTNDSGHSVRCASMEEIGRFLRTQ